MRITFEIFSINLKILFMETYHYFRNIPIKSCSTTKYLDLRYKNEA